MNSEYKSLPLVYACSGCSSAAQLANHVAVRLDRQGSAEMSCIAGVGGDVPALLKVARAGRPILVIDGCPLVCAKRSLERHGITPDKHMQLAECGVKKRLHADFDPVEAEQVLAMAKETAASLERGEKRSARAQSERGYGERVQPGL
ncbi:putative zinc-binding protein [Paraburkholderia dinghuensis]|uniref:Zinc-binding protein n=1 Tax=Paraburkholderia dinghuensis TaxID=2305225 RepID=A0A3N6N2A3_9BURK|nr:putative zinc-binding protein [Paraburkholderia dinghuensis]RQH08625.1 zinc-binding protein [Paraburkholderia dinghuensis]